MPFDIRLVDYRQNIKVLSPNTHYEPRTYSRVAPVLVKAKQDIRVLTQSGYAVGWECKIKEQAPLFPNALLAGVDVSFEQVDDLQWKTSWSYVMAITDEQELDLAMWQALPATTEVYP